MLHQPGEPRNQGSRERSLSGAPVPVVKAVRICSKGEKRDGESEIKCRKQKSLLY